MRILIAAVGRLKDGPERVLAARYLERANQSGRTLGLGPVDVLEIAESRARRPEDRKREEAAALREAIDARATLIALDERGKTQTSEAFAADLARRRDEGPPSLAFLIGGADGLDPELLARCTARLAFGQMTWPHGLVRVLLAEQVYRAITIIAGHPYHRA